MSAPVPLYDALLIPPATGRQADAMVHALEARHGVGRAMSEELTVLWIAVAFGWRPSDG